MPKGTPLTPEEIDHRRHAIFFASIELILKQGFAATSMQEIAEAAGVGKSTLYDYFPSKDEVLLFIFEEELEMAQHMAEAVVAEQLPAGEKLNRIFTQEIETLVSRKNFALELYQQMAQISQNNQQRIQVKRYEYQDLIRRVIDQGVEEGIFRAHNTRLSARTLVAMTSTIVYTTRPSGSPQDMLEDLLDIFLHGIEV